MEDLIQLVQAEYIRTDMPEFGPGDTLSVNVRIKEGNKERIQKYKGVCIQRRGSGGTATFTVRKISGGIGVERIFPLFSPNVESIEVLRRGRVRRARLFYLRGKVGKKARIREKRTESN
jgi:large subunit ribosomal protein L19